MRLSLARDGRVDILAWALKSPENQFFSTPPILTVGPDGPFSDLRFVLTEMAGYHPDRKCCPPKRTGCQGESEI